jgi:hypothetical protein
VARVLLYPAITVDVIARREASLAEQYDVTILTVRPVAHPHVLAVLEKTLSHAPDLLACWYSDVGALNQVLILRKVRDPATSIADRQAVLGTRNPFGIGEFITGMAMDTYVSFDFATPMTPGLFGPYYEVRTYLLQPDGLLPTIELWRKALPARSKVSPALAAMTSVTGVVARFMHIWPYKSLDERAHLRSQVVADGIWPPPGGPGYLVSQQADIYLPASFSPMR